jgi:dynactin 1
MKVLIAMTNHRSVTGTIKFIGHTMFAPGIWIGVELTTSDGKNNGSVQGHYYFHCPMNYGLFIREEFVTPLEEEKPIRSAAHISSSSNNNAAANPLSTIRNELKKSTTTSSSNKAVEEEKKSSNKTAAAVNQQQHFSKDAMSMLSEITETNYSYASSVDGEDNNNSNNNSNSNNLNRALSMRSSSLSPSKRMKSSSVLKMKLSKLMELLNQQLEMIEMLENEEKMDSSSLKVLQLRSQIQNISNIEQETIDSFQRTWKEFPSSNDTSAAADAILQQYVSNNSSINGSINENGKQDVQI